MRTHLKTVFDGDEDSLFIGKAQNNGEFDWYPFLKWTDVRDYSDFDFRYIVSAMAVARYRMG